MLTWLTKGEGELRVEKMPTLADKGGRGGIDPPFSADIIGEEPLMSGCECHLTSTD